MKGVILSLYERAERAEAEVARLQVEIAEERAQVATWMGVTKRAQADAARLREAIEKLEWVGIHVTVCPWCGATSMGKHQEDCQRQAALSDTAEEGEKWNG